MGRADAADIGSSDKLKAVFGTRDDVVPEQVYGSIDAGTARWLTIPSTTHPGDHLSTEAIGDAISWMGQTLTGGDTRVDSDQIWYWKELGTLIALIGGACVLLGTFALILMVPLFRVLAEPLREPGSEAGRSRWTDLLVTTTVPALSYFPLTGLVPRSAPIPFFHRGSPIRFSCGRLQRAVCLMPSACCAVEIEAAPEARFNAATRLSLAALSALLSVCGLYIAVVVSDGLFKSDLRFWVVALETLALHHVPTAFARIVLPFVRSFVASQWAWLRGSRSCRNRGNLCQHDRREMSSACCDGGRCLCLAVRHRPSSARGSAVHHRRHPVRAGAHADLYRLCVRLSTYRRIEVGAMICGAFVTWYVVAGQATHV